MRNFFLLLIAMAFQGLTVCSCVSVNESQRERHTAYAEFFDIPDDSHIVSFSPYTGEVDTMVIDTPMRNIVCMSTSHVACLDAIGMDSVISAVSGLRFVSSEELKSRDDVFDIGYDPEIDYERIVALKPDLLVAYSVSAALPQYVVKLRSLGVKVLMLSDHLESHPLARAEYVRLFGALTGSMDKADSLFAAVEENYLSIAAHADTADRAKVLFNLPYGDQWYIPGEESYMSKLVSDAGGTVLGAEKGSRNSSVISLEQAYLLAKEADVWLNPGTCSTRKEIISANP